MTWQFHSMLPVSTYLVSFQDFDFIFRDLSDNKTEETEKTLGFFVRTAKIDWILFFSRELAQ